MSFDALAAYLESFVSLSFVLDPAKQQEFDEQTTSGVNARLSPQEIGRATAKHWFAELSKDPQKDVLELDEFKKSAVASTEKD